MKPKDKAVKMTELIIRVIDYAQKHKLDIHERNHVKQILEALDTASMENEELDEFMTLLQDADTFMEMTALKKSKEETKLLN